MMPFHETPVVAIPTRHRLASRRRLSIEALADEPMIVPDRSSRPHSHDLTIKLFKRAGLRPHLSQIAEEKQTIVQLVAAGLGLAIVPRWPSRLGMAGVRFVPLASREVAALDPADGRRLAAQRPRPAARRDARHAPPSACSRYAAEA